MSKYTTGEIAKLCGVSVRTVQYYDSRNILVPTELSEGGRRLYSDSDLEKMKIICFLREMGLSINSIGELLSEENPGDVISILLDQQEEILRNELSERQTKLDMVTQIRRELRDLNNFSVESIGDIAHRMQNKKKLDRVHATMLIMGLPINIGQWTTILLWIMKGLWIPFVVWVVLAVPYGIWITSYYFKSVAYICPQCHKIFRPSLKEAFFANHTPKLRKLTCTCCGYKGFCVETYGKGDEVHE